MKLVVGLGNPGKRYRSTPHNVGYEVVEEIAARRKLKWASARRLDAEFCEGYIGGADCLLFKPTTFMNASGEAVGPLARGEKIDIADDMLVVVDDIALELGAVRLRAQGSSGRHRGRRAHARGRPVRRPEQLRAHPLGCGTTPGGGQNGLSRRGCRRGVVAQRHRSGDEPLQRPGQRQRPTGVSPDPCPGARVATATSPGLLNP